LTFGIAICHEGWRYPETVRWAARRGAQIVFHPKFHEAEPGGYVPSVFADPANTFHEKADLPLVRRGGMRALALPDHRRGCAGSIGVADVSTLRKHNGTLALVGASACWGGSTTLSKALLSSLPPLTLLVIQLLASSAALWLILLCNNAKIRLGRPERVAALTGVLEPGLAYGFVMAGLATTTASNVTLLAAVEPVLIVIVAWILLRQTPSGSILRVMFAALAGVLLISWPDIRNPGQGQLRGDALVLIGVGCAAVYVVLSSRYVKSIKPLQLVALQQSAALLSAFLLLAMAFWLGLEHHPSAVDARTLVMAIVSGLVQYAAAFWLYLLGMRTVPVAVAGLSLCLIPVFGVSTAALFLSEALGPFQWLGAIIVVASLFALTRTKTRGSVSLA